MKSKNKILICVLSLIICILIVGIIISFTKCGVEKNNKSEKKIETTKIVKESKNGVC